ncbi:MAG: 6-phosphogluconolactonase, partial [Proteobacteria bacterium]|nr:6-phosphogluconolactonase [Pseudomonadota bacterium]
MLKVFSNEESLANAAAAVFVSQCKKSIARSGRFSVVLSGGNTPRQTYELIAKEPFRSQVDWTKVHVFWGDERLVDKSDDRSNFRLATDALLSQVPIPPTQVHPISAIRGPEEATREYESIIRRYFSQSAPRFDLVLLGLGVDGHTASIFPGPP